MNGTSHGHILLSFSQFLSASVTLPINRKWLVSTNLTGLVDYDVNAGSYASENSSGLQA